MPELAQMKIGYVNPRRTFTEKAQVEALREAGVADKDIYVQGRGAEDLEAALKRTRDGLVYCADGMRTLGASAKMIREAMILVEKRKRVIVDAARKQRSDDDRWAMYHWACGKVIAEKNGLTPAKASKGGKTKATMLAHDRLDEKKAEAVWKDQRFGSNLEATEYMNKLHPPLASKGWTAQMAYQHFGESGRPRGRKSFKLNKRK